MHGEKIHAKLVQATATSDVVYVICTQSHANNARYTHKIMLTSVLHIALTLFVRNQISEVKVNRQL